MGGLDFIFLHVPKLNNYYRPISHFIWINFLPMGLLGWPTFSSVKAFPPKSSPGSRVDEDHHFSIIEYLREKAPRVIALDLTGTIRVSM